MEEERVLTQIDSSYLEPTPDDDAAIDAMLDSEEIRDEYDDYIEQSEDIHPSNPYLIRNPASLIPYVPLAPDSELKKPWKEMNPYFAIEEAKLLPLPERRWLMTAEGIAIVASKANIIAGTDEYARLESMINGSLVTVHPLLTRCPMCRTGSLKSKNGGRVCPCCSGFIMVPENSIISFMTSLNDVRETDRIDKQMKGIIRAKKDKKKDKVIDGKEKKLTKKQKDVIKQQELKESGIWAGVENES